MEEKELTQEEVEKLLKEKEDAFRANEENMRLVTEAAQRVHDFYKTIEYPVSSLDKVKEAFVGVCSLHNLSIEQLETELKTLALEAKEHKDDISSDSKLS